MQMCLLSELQKKMLHNLLRTFSFHNIILVIESATKYFLIKTSIRKVDKQLYDCFSFQYQQHTSWLHMCTIFLIKLHLLREIMSKFFKENEKM